MSALGNINLRVDKLPKENFYKGKNDAVYCNITFTINDDTRFGNNVAATVPQTEEERLSKKPKEYIGNGKIFWTDGAIAVAEKEEKENQSDSGMPF